MAQQEGSCNEPPNVLIGPNRTNGRMCVETSGFACGVAVLSHTVKAVENETCKILALLFVEQDLLLKHPFTKHQRKMQRREISPIHPTSRILEKGADSYFAPATS